MTLKEELEILRGEPIEVFDGDPMDIPCIETSDAEKLCKHPVVSVCMVTYNHESYIRQAIEGVLMQKTDFEYELVIGEDCSQDKTREICFEYQKKYPDKIRVLWWHENVLKLGGNGRRVRARCRGEFIAFYEGDDYWIDPFKLQKQVKAMRAYPSVGMCFSKAIVHHEVTGVNSTWDARSNIPGGLIDGQAFFKWHVFGSACSAPSEDIEFIMTSTVLVRAGLLLDLIRANRIFSWMLMLGDTTMWCGMATCGDVYYLPEEVSVYRINAGGVCFRNPMPMSRDARIAHLYWIKVWQWNHIGPIELIYDRLFVSRVRLAISKSHADRVGEAKKILQLKEFGFVSGGYRYFILLSTLPCLPSWALVWSAKVLSWARRRLSSNR